MKKLSNYLPEFALCQLIPNGYINTFSELNMLALFPGIYS